MIVSVTANQFILNSRQGYCAVQCSKCKHVTPQAMLINFKFYTTDKPKFDYYYTYHKGPHPREKFTIQDNKVICHQCCGFSLDKPRPEVRMEGHDYTWTDGVKSYCPKGHIASWSRKRKVNHDEWVIRSIKKLKKEVAELKCLAQKHFANASSKDTLPEKHSPKS